MHQLYEPLGNLSGRTGALKPYRTYVLQIHGCNAIHVFCGLVSAALAFVQFSPIGLDNNYIDVRLLNAVHIVTGFVSISMVLRNNGSICAKSLYHLSLTLSLFTIGFYAESLREAVGQYKEYRKIEKVAVKGEDAAEQANFEELANQQMGKVIICAVMIAISSIEAVVSIGSIALLNQLACDRPQTNADQNNAKQNQLKNSGRLAFVAVMKFFFGCLTIGLSAYLEHVHKKADKYITTGLNELAGGFALVSGCVDLYALYSGRHQVLNMKVSMTFSVISAVMAIKTLDMMMLSSFVKDLKDYTGFDQELQPQSEKREKFVQFVINASVIGSLTVVFVHCIVAVLETGVMMEKTHSLLLNPAQPMNEPSEIAKKLHRQRNCVGLLQFLWGAGLITLAIVSFVPSETSSGYSGGSVLWLGILFAASGCVVCSQLRTLTTTVYVFSVICAMLSLEYFCYNVNLLVQASTSSRYETDDAANSTVHNGRVTLYAIQASLFLTELITALYTVLRFDAVIRNSVFGEEQFSGKPCYRTRLCCLSVLHLAYALFTIALSIASEVAVFHYRIYSVPAFVKLTNGVVVFAVAIVQIRAARSPKLLLSSGILQIISATIAFFVIAPVTSALYRLVYNYRIEYEGAGGTNLDDDQLFRKQILELFIGLIASMLFLTLLEFVVSVVSAMSTSYLLHHHYNTPSEQVSAAGLTPSIVPNCVFSTTYPSQATSKLSAHNSTSSYLPCRYFDNSFRSCGSERIYDGRDSLVFGNGGGLHQGTYGHIQVDGRRQDSYAQTNIRHMFSSLHDAYMSSYNLNR